MGQQLLTLGGKAIEVRAPVGSHVRIFSVSTNAALPIPLRSSRAFLVKGANIPDHFAHYILLESPDRGIPPLPDGAEFTVLPRGYAYLGDGDIIRISPADAAVRVLFRASSSHNSFLVTEQCNHYCLMCSQPPKRGDDSWIIRDIERAIPLIPKDTPEVGFTGGEPTLAGEQFLSLLRLAKSHLPSTAIHILSNGRAFRDYGFAKKYTDIGHPDIMIGIPLYSDVAPLHDYIVQSNGAFDETIQGILNLKQLQQQVEVRVVIHKQSLPRLTQLCEFLARNLLFVDHVALMGLEMTGFTKANLESLWVDPFDYKDKLSEAVDILAKAGMDVSLYNHQLCLVNDDVHAYYRKSISDWKNEFAPECRGCARTNECGGFFSSAMQVRYSKHIVPFSPN